VCCARVKRVDVRGCAKHHDVLPGGLTYSCFLSRAGTDPLRFGRSGSPSPPAFAFPLRRPRPPFSSSSSWECPMRLARSCHQPLPREFRWAPSTFSGRFVVITFFFFFFTLCDRIALHFVFTRHQSHSFFCVLGFPLSFFLTCCMTIFTTYNYQTRNQQ
jgi:hypothetical protein